MSLSSGPIAYEEVDSAVLKENGNSAVAGGGAFGISSVFSYPNSLSKSLTTTSRYSEPESTWCD